MIIKFGDIFYSDYFKSNGVVVEYVDADNWWFVMEKGNYSMHINRARTRPENLKWIRRACK